ncbi:MAG TPA: biotin carboxylase N-terminal domain-containing protein, partial [Myxococcota bacterium]|nr:biotin carboxylase N-terminal domain-containing protein [Myxococcota bacterium]
MHRLLIANRGEIAVRIARSASELGVETVALHPPEDADLARGYGVDRIVALTGSGPAAYLDIEEIVGIGRVAGCDAVHPGYGFLSESAPFAQACLEAGLTFVGPPVEALRVLGDKAAARDVAAGLDVPILLGTDSPLTIEAARDFFDCLPEESAIVLKAVAGGGGRGLRVVRHPDQLARAFERCRSEALRSFGVESLFAEQYVEEARHVEVQ